MFRGMLEADMIKELAEGDRSEKLTGENVVNCLLNPKVGDTLPTNHDDFAGAVSFEAWIARRKAMQAASSTISPPERETDS